MALGGPVVLAVLLQSVYALVDLGFVARLGDAAVAGLSISLQVFFIVLAVSQVLGITALANISQAYGAGHIDEARSAFAAFFYAALVLGFLSTCTAYLVAEPYVNAFTDDPEARVQGLAYFRINTITFTTQLLLLVFGHGFRGSGDFLTPTKLMAGSVIANMLLDPLLIFGLGPVPAMGIAGAAWATVITQGSASLVYMLLLFRPRSERAMRWARPAWTPTFFIQLFTRGLPAGLQFLMLSLVLGIVLGAMKPYGASWTACAGGGFRVLQQSILPMVAIGSASAAMAGQNFGAQRFDRLRATCQVAIRWTLIYGCVVALMLFFGGRIAGRLFAEGATLDTAEIYFHWSAPTTIAFGFSFIPSFVLQALGRAVLPMISGAFRIASLAALVYLLVPAFELGPEFVFGAATFSAFVEGGFSVEFLRRQLRAMPAGPPIPESQAPVA